MKKKMSSLYGFHLIEILSVLAMVAILISLSIPIYSQYYVHERRLEAAHMLSKLSIELEKFYIENNTYQNASLSSLHFPEFIAKENYRLLIQSANHNHYLIAAKPIGKQLTKDKLCAALMLNSNGEKTISGTGTVEDCW